MEATIIGHEHLIKPMSDARLTVKASDGREYIGTRALVLVEMAGLTIESVILERRCETCDEWVAS